MPSRGSRSWQASAIRPKNLAAAAEGENYEWTDMYDGFAKTAEAEGSWSSAARFPHGRRGRAPSARSAIAPCCTMWKRPPSSQRARSRFGKAVQLRHIVVGTAAPEVCPCAIIRRAILNSTPRTIKAENRSSQEAVQAACGAFFTFQNDDVFSGFLAGARSSLATRLSKMTREEVHHGRAGQQEA